MSSCAIRRIAYVLNYYSCLSRVVEQRGANRDSSGKYDCLNAILYLHNYIYDDSEILSD